jgi:membrane-associated phospholipid phosphatase
MTTFLVLLFTVATALAVPTSVYSQAATPTPQAEPSLRTFFPDLAADVRHLPSNPANLSIAIGGVLSASAYPLDDEVAEWDPNAGFTSGTWIGNPFALAAGTLVTYGVGHWRHQPRVTRAAADMLRAQSLSIGLTYAVKYTVRRERPDHSSHDSFPSGHASQTFASATVLARHFGPRAAWPAYAVATFVSISRVNQQRHFLSDMVFGAGLGIAVGWNETRRMSNWAVAPDVSRSRFAIQVSRVFTPQAHITARRRNPGASARR